MADKVKEAGVRLYDMAASCGGIMEEWEMRQEEDRVEMTRVQLFVNSVNEVMAVRAAVHIVEHAADLENPSRLAELVLQKKQYDIPGPLKDALKKIANSDA